MLSVMRGAAISNAADPVTRGNCKCNGVLLVGPGCPQGTVVSLRTAGQVGRLNLEGRLCGRRRSARGGRRW
jgi:hypothetical protein